MRAIIGWWVESALSRALLRSGAGDPVSFADKSATPAKTTFVTLVSTACMPVSTFGFRQAISISADKLKVLMTTSACPLKFVVEPNPMKPVFPKRVKQHVSETASLKLFKSYIPDEWVVRELGERDYGVDVAVEIVRNGMMSGDIIVGQLKGVQHDPLRGEATFKAISETTANYLLRQPAPAFLFVASLETRQVYWRSLRDHYRNLGVHDKLSDVKLIGDFNLSATGLLALNLMQLSEREWDRVERAIISALMFFTSLGPLVLGCRRFPRSQPIPLAVQQLLVSHFSYNDLIQRYLLKRGKRYPHLPELYDKAFRAGHITGDFKFTGQGARDFLEIFIRDYLDAIEQCDYIVRRVQNKYWREKYPYQIGHIDAFPPYFLDDDWYPRYYFDEYENETQHISLDFFADIDEITRRPFVEIYNERFSK